MISKKICLVGDFNVGKTSLIRRFVDRQFSDRYLSTVGVKISRKKVELTEMEGTNNSSVQLLIWDLEGSTKFKAIAPTYLKGSAGAIVVGDLTRQPTIDNILNHIKLFLSINPTGQIIVALNKVDLLEEKKLEKIMADCENEVTKAIADCNASFERQFCGIYKTSAKTGMGVDEIFQTLTTKIMEES